MESSSSLIILTCVKYRYQLNLRSNFPRDISIAMMWKHLLLVVVAFCDGGEGILHAMRLQNYIEFTQKPE